MLVKHRFNRTLQIHKKAHTMIESLLVNLAALGTVFGWAFLSFWSAIPAGIALDLSPLLVGLTVTLSYGSGALLVVIIGAPLRERIRRRMEKRTQEDDTPQPPNRMIVMVQSAWTRYGLIGLAIAAPMTVGAQVGAVIGLTFGEKPLRLVVFMTLGAGIWAVLITLAVVTGLMTVSEII